jgi:hypothetical protein
MIGSRFVTNAFRIGVVCSLSACGGGGSAPPPPPPATYTVGGNVSGLQGSGLALENNGGSALAVSASGTFVFPATLATGAAYAVTVAVQPDTPAQYCSVSAGSGVVATSNVTSVTVDCTSPRFTELTNQPAESGFLSLLLTDGRVMVQSNNDSGSFYSLTPDSQGSYLRGTWHLLAHMPTGYAPFAGAQAVLADGRVLFVGGEYNLDQYDLPFAPSGLTNMSALYDPKADSWTMIAAPPGVAYIGDATSTIMPDGSFVYGDKLGRGMWRLDPASLTWSSVAAIGKADDFAEENWTLLPNGDLFTIDVGNPRHAEHFDPIAAQWYSDGNTPVRMTSPTENPAGLTYGPAPVALVGGVTYGPGPAGTYFPPGEVGPALLLPNGTVFATGAANSGEAAHTAIYTPGATPADSGTFVVGPDFQPGDDAEDTSAVLLPSGHVLISVISARFYEYDGSQMPITGALPSNDGDTQYFLLPLPNGQVLVTGGVTQIYSDSGSANPAWAPTITASPASVTRGSSYAISGTQFNGLSQAASFGDELSAATNYPLVRIANVATGQVVYARTHAHSTMAVATGSAIVSTHFDVPMQADAGASTLVVVANGIASVPVPVTVN